MTVIKVLLGVEKMKKMCMRTFCVHYFLYWTKNQRGTGRNRKKQYVKIQTPKDKLNIYAAK